MIATRLGARPQGRRRPDDPRSRNPLGGDQGSTPARNESPHALASTPRPGPLRPGPPTTTPTIEHTNNRRRSPQMPQQDSRAHDSGQSAPAQPSQAGIPTGGWSPTKLARASACGALALGAAQIVDMRVTGRQASDTPLRAFEAVSHHQVRGGAARAAIGYTVQSTLGPLGAVAAVSAGERMTRRFGAAVLPPLLVASIVSPALGASAWPWRWTRIDWIREFALKSAFAIAVTAALR